MLGNEKPRTQMAGGKLGDQREAQSCRSAQSCISSPTHPFCHPVSLQTGQALSRALWTPEDLAALRPWSLRRSQTSGGQTSGSPGYDIGEAVASATKTDKSGRSPKRSLKGPSACLGGREGCERRLGHRDLGEGEGVPGRRTARATAPRRGPVKGLSGGK